jgi:hypothetical protein
MSDFCTVTDGTTTLKFFGNPDYKPLLHVVGQALNPLGYSKTVVSRDGPAKRGGTWTMVAVDDETLLPTIASDAALEALLLGVAPLTITFPDETTTMKVTPDPATDPLGATVYSQWLFQYVNTWTVKFFEVS